MGDLNVNGVSVRFGGIKAISDVNLTMARKQVLGLIGPNGAGKTTLVNCISGFQRPTEGDIRIGGEEVSRWSPDKARHKGIARTFQGGRLFGSMTVGQNVEVAALSLGLSRSAARERARDLLAWVGYSGDMDRPADTVPYVDERRVGIARALVGEPSFLLLDEPAAGMSDAECEQLIRLIREVPDQIGCGVLLIEHNLHLISNICDRVHVLDGGCTLATGTPSEILSNRTVLAAYLGDEA